MKRSFLALGVAAVLSAAGCAPGGSSTVLVQGSVTLDNAPLKTGSITFRPTDGTVSPVGGDIKDGKYSVNAPVANCKVEITASEAVPAPAGHKGPGGGTVRSLIPDRYNNKTELSVDVKGAMTKNFELTGK